MILHEPSPIVQLSYSWDALLVSSEKRTIVWDFLKEKVTQVGQKERKRLVNTCLTSGQFPAFEGVLLHFDCQVLAMIFTKVHPSDHENSSTG